jgi:hypothetical protein
MKFSLSALRTDTGPRRVEALSYNRTMASIRGHVHHADVAFDPGADIRAPGGAVTLALCGSWEHEGSCRWPHHTAVDPSITPSAVRVVYVVGDDDLDHLRSMIESALAGGDGWDTVAIRADRLTVEEMALARRLHGEDI